MAHLNHYREQARRCLRLAYACTDQTVADRLRLLAADLVEQADEAGADAAGPDLAPDYGWVPDRGLR